MLHKWENNCSRSTTIEWEHLNIISTCICNYTQFAKSELIRSATNRNEHWCKFTKSLIATTELKLSCSALTWVSAKQLMILFLYTLLLSQTTTHLNYPNYLIEDKTDLNKSKPVTNADTIPCHVRPCNFPHDPLPNIYLWEYGDVRLHCTWAMEWHYNSVLSFLAALTFLPSLP